MSNRESRFDSALDDCLDRMRRGESLEDCLESYPDDAPKLEPLLASAASAWQAARRLEPRPEFRIRARREMRERLAQAIPKRDGGAGRWKPLWAGAVAVVLTLVFSGAGTVVAAGSSMPDEALYPLKLAVEEVRLALAPSPVRKAAVLAELADKRVEEIVYVARKGDAVQVEAVSAQLKAHLEAVVALSEADAKNAGTSEPGGSESVGEGQPRSHGREALKKKLEEKAIVNEERLRQALANAPDPVKPALARSVQETKQAYDRVLESVAKEPPGQVGRAGASSGQSRGQARKAGDSPK
jgi:hypothetical protein